MEILSAEHIYKLDQATIQSEGITSFDLMERAATACFERIQDILSGFRGNVKVFCGVGNNGGDGLAITRLLIQEGYNVSPYVVDFSEKRSKDFLLNYDLLKDLKIWPEIINEATDIPEISNEDIVIDAITGIGLSRVFEGMLEDLTIKINKSKAFVISIDVPSGMFIDKFNSKSAENVIESDLVLTFQYPKLGFLLPDNASYIKHWEILDIQLDKSPISNFDVHYHFIQQSDIQSVYKQRQRFSHKGTYGHVLLIGGSYGKIGAISLASKASIKSGSGLVSVLVPSCGYEILQVSNPEVMVEVDNDREIHNFNYHVNPTAIAIGPGLGTSSKTKDGFSKFIKSNKKPLVIDADALNILSQNKELLAYLPKQTVLTPHPKELERLIGTWSDDYEKIEKVKTLSNKHHVVVLVKGANTMIVDGEEVFFNSTGNNALATGGSGDVLTGIIASLLGQGYSARQSALIGVYLHGLTADLAFQELGFESFIASDIINYLGKAFIETFYKR